MDNKFSTLIFLRKSEKVYIVATRTWTSNKFSALPPSTSSFERRGISLFLLFLIIFATYSLFSSPRVVTCWSKLVMSMSLVSCKGLQRSSYGWLKLIQIMLSTPPCRNWCYAMELGRYFDWGLPLIDIIHCLIALVNFLWVFTKLVPHFVL